KKLVKDLYEITGLDKRSFASKYLHFHLPDLFFIYDSRAVTALGKYKIKSKLSNKFKSKTIDKEYANFFCKCFELKNIIDKLHNVQITPRHLDNLLIENANNDLK